MRREILEQYGTERCLTCSAGGKILTNIGVWTPDSEWLVYDTRSDSAGAVFDGTEIKALHLSSGEQRTLFHSLNGACCGVVTCHPRKHQVVFILGPENPSPDWDYGPARRQGVLVDFDAPGIATNLDARDLVPPFTPGALRGGSHVHLFSPEDDWVSFTYEDHLLSKFEAENDGTEINLRNVGVSFPAGPVSVPKTHPRNHSGEFFTVLVTRTTANPAPGSDEISKAFEEGWIGNSGYKKPDGSWQKKALAFQGLVTLSSGEKISEVYLVDLPDDLTRPSDEGPLTGTATTRPRPPLGTRQRRLTFTEPHRFPGIQGPRHWLRSSPDGTQIAFLKKDDDGVVQLWTISPNGGEPCQVTSNAKGIASAFSWSPNGRFIAHVIDGSVAVTEVEQGNTFRLTRPLTDLRLQPRPEACVFSPDGRKIAFVRPQELGGKWWNQLCLVELPTSFCSPE